MNDFSELEAELKKLRPSAASPELTARIERAWPGAESGRRQDSHRGSVATPPQLPGELVRAWARPGGGGGPSAAGRLDVDQPAGKRQSVVAMTPAAVSRSRFP